MAFQSPTNTPMRPMKKLNMAVHRMKSNHMTHTHTLLSQSNLHSWMFLIHIEVSDVFRIFSMYTPLNPLVIQANKIATKPISDELKLWEFL